MLFFIQKTRIKPDGKAPILARITVNGNMSTFSTQESIEPDRWDSKAQRTVGRTEAEKDINSHLVKLLTATQNSYYDLLAEGEQIRLLRALLIERLVLLDFGLRLQQVPTNKPFFFLPNASEKSSSKVSSVS